MKERASTRPRSRRHARAAAVALALLLGAAALLVPVHRADAASLGELRARANAVGIAPGEGGAGEQAAIDRLGRLALEFLDAAEVGDSGAAATYEAIAQPLERSHKAHRAALDRLAKGVIDADGDLDALYESPTWQEHQQLAAQALYFLNWLKYRGALFFDGAKRKTLLEEAASGFGEFATSDRETPVVIESHLGRGLANLELDRADWAIADFEAILQAKSAPPERVRKAELALGEAYIKAGRSTDALRVSKRALDNATPSDQPRAKLTRARALLMAAASSPGNRSAYQGEAGGLLSDLQASGGPWGARATQIVRGGLDNPKIWASSAKTKSEPPPPSEWDQTKQLVATGKFKDAIPRLERLRASNDAEDVKQHAEARYLLGIARFRTGDAAGAITTFDAVLAAKDGASYRDDAAYLRFKANETIYAADPTPERLPAYEQSITAFVGEFPKHKAAAEARFRLGEIRQRQERWADAVGEYAKVSGDAIFELRAAFAIAQCSVKQLERTPEGTKPDAKLRAQADEALARFWQQIEGKDTGAFGDVTEVIGQAALMTAYLAALAEPPDYERALARLEGFEERYPKLTEQQPQVVKLRLAAFARLGRLPEAATEAARPAVAQLDPIYLDDLATRFLTTSARLAAAGKKEEAAAGKRAALLLSERALASKDEAALPPVVRRRLRSTLAALYEESGKRAEALALYRAILAAEPEVVSARAGAARILEAQGDSNAARTLWDEVASAPPGKAGWLEACYQSARLSVALGEQGRACTLLRQVPPALLTNANAETPRKIQEMLRTTCAS